MSADVAGGVDPAELAARYRHALATAAGLARLSPAERFTYAILVATLADPRLARRLGADGPELAGRVALETVVAARLPAPRAAMARPSREWLAHERAGRLSRLRGRLARAGRS